MIKSIQGYSYKLNQYIGKGYSSTVHKGKRDSTGQQVSIKVIEMCKLQDPINHMLLQFQVAALKSLSRSSNVLHLHDVYATKNNTYIITELMQGDLHNLLKQRKQFPYYEACQIIKQIINGYLDVYRNGYLHRDIKPANIFYKNGIYKIGDFGFAIPAQESHQHRTYNVGSPVYMPPEALKDNQYSFSCDTWAIGVIFYQLLKGLVPWRAISEPKLYDKIMNEPLYDLTQGIPEVGRTFLARLLHLDPVQRMMPEELATWPSKLFAVEIRSMTPGQNRPFENKAPLQEISLTNNNNIIINNQNSAYSRSKSYSSSQVPNYVSGLRINLPSSQNNQNQLGQKLGHNIFIAPPTPNSINNVSSQIHIPTNFQSVKISQPPTQQFSQKSSTIFLPQQKKQIAQMFRKSFMTPEMYATNMISYIKFIHRVVKFISQPNDIQLKDLEFSLIRTLFKQIERVKRFADPQNLQLLNIHGWKQYVKTQQCEELFIKKLNKLSQKYKMFHPLPANEFILEVYKEQLSDGIHKIYDHLTKSQNPSQKTFMSLDLLISFYQVWSWKDNKSQIRNFNFVEFLDTWKFDKLMEQDVYSGVRPNLPEIKQKIKALGLIVQKQEESSMKVNLGAMMYPQELVKLR